MNWTVCLIRIISITCMDNFIEAENVFARVKMLKIILTTPFVKFVFVAPHFDQYKISHLFYHSPSHCRFLNFGKIIVWSYGRLKWSFMYQLCFLCFSFCIVSLISYLDVGDSVCFAILSHSSHDTSFYCEQNRLGFLCLSWSRVSATPASSHAEHKGMTQRPACLLFCIWMVDSCFS